MAKTVLITGGTGFLGRNLAPALTDAFRVVLSGRNNKQNLHVQQVTGCEVVPMDVASIESVRDAFVSVRPDVVIHAAATKFVDLAEKQPMECVDVNVLGSQNIARVSAEKGVEIAIGISTDKAAPPIRNIYGLSKGMMERIFCAMDEKAETAFACVRYGNVAWSTGSVLPIWKKMHETDGIIRSTGPEMRRFFFSVDEAVKLVSTSLENISTIRGKVLSRYMKAAQVQDLLDIWIAEKGGSWERMAGRPGERIDEYLIGDIELPYTREVEYDGIPHYVIAFNEKSEHPLDVGLSSANTERLSAEEMSRLINSPRD